jgi:enoyl-CoA hydratase/carnithine racemase
MTVEIERTHGGRVETWWLARENARNAISLDMWSQLRDAAVNVHEQVRVVVIRGRGEHFSAGADIIGLGRSLAADHDGSSYREINAAAEFAVSHLRVPTIAAINGYCVGGGVQLALACDLRVADHTSRFAVTPAKLGIVYPASALKRLVAIVGPASALELLLTAETIDAARAHEISLVNRLVTNIDDGTNELVNALLSRSTLTQQATKSVVAALMDTFDVEELGRIWERASLEHRDLREGLAAFAEKRDPQF